MLTKNRGGHHHHNVLIKSKSFQTSLISFLERVTGVVGKEMPYWDFCKVYGCFYYIFWSKFKKKHVQIVTIFVGKIPQEWLFFSRQHSSVLKKYSYFAPFVQYLYPWFPWRLGKDAYYVSDTHFRKVADVDDKCTFQKKIEQWYICKIIIF